MNFMRKSRLSCHQPNRMIKHNVAGTTTPTTSCIFGVHRNTSAYCLHRLREIIALNIEAKAKEVFRTEI